MGNEFNADIVLRLIDQLTPAMANVQSQLKTAMANMAGSTAPVNKAMEQLSKSLSGDKIIQDAKNITAAVQQIGGATKLTEAEAARYNATLTQAMAKLKALGQEAPADMQALAAATKQAEGAAQNLSGTLSQMAGTLGIAFGAAAVVAGVKGFIGQVMDTAAKVHDLSEKLEVSSEAVQRWSYAAKLTGTDMDTVGRSVAFMNKTLAGGSDSTVQALRDAGLEFKTIRAGAPEQSFDAIVAAVKQIPDPMKQAKVMVELFGKAGQDLLPAVKEGLAAIAKEAPVMKDATINALEAAGDSLDQLWARLTARVGTSVGVIALTVEELGKGMAGLKNLKDVGFFNTDDEFIDKLMKIRAAQNALTEEQKRTIEASVKAGESNDLLAIGLQATKESIVAYADALRKAGAQSPVPASFVADLKAAEAGYRALTSEQKAQLEAGFRLGASNADIAKGLNITEGVLGLAKKAYEENRSAISKSAEEAKKAADEMRQAYDTIRLASIPLTAAQQNTVVALMKVNAAAGQEIVSLKTLAREAGAAEVQVKVFEASLKSMAARLLEIEQAGNAAKIATLSLGDALQSAGEKLPIPSMKDLAEFSLRSATDVDALRGSVEDLERAGRFGSAAIQTLNKQVATLPNVASSGAAALDEAKVKVISLSDVLGTLSNDFAQIAQIGGDSFGGIARDIGLAIKTVDQMANAIKAINGIQANGQGNSPTNILAQIASYTSLATAVLSLADAYIQASIAKAKLDALNGIATQLATSFSSATKFSQGLNSEIVSLRNNVVALSQADLKALGVDVDGLGEAYRDALGIVAEVYAEAVKLSDIIKELGGFSALTADQLAVVQDRTAYLFRIIALGGVDAARATKTLDETLSQMAAFDVAQTGHVTKFFLDMATAARVAGIELDGVNDFFKGQATALATGLGDLLTQPLVINAAAVGKAVKDAQAAVDAAKADATDALAKAQDALTAALTTQHGEAERNKDALRDLGYEAVLAFNAAIATGQDFVGALSAIAPHLDTIKKAYDDLGLSIDDAAVKGLTLENTILNGPGGTGKAISGLQAIFTAATNMPGLMSPEMFAAQQRSLASVYTQTQGATANAGGTTINALLPFQQTLHDLADFASKNKLAIDDKTQQMIDQSKELGIWTDDFQTDGERTRESIANLIKSNDELAATIGAAALHVGTPVAPGGARFLAGDTDPLAPGMGFDAPSFTNGSGGIRDFGSRGTWALLHGREEVRTETQANTAGASQRPAMVTQNVYQTVHLTSNDLNDPRRVVAIYKEAMLKDTDGIRTMHEVVAVKAVNDAS